MRARCFGGPPLWFAAWVALVLTAGGAKPAEGALYEVELRRDVEYGRGGGEVLTLDLAKPINPKERLPALVFIPGGAWRMDNRNTYLTTIQEIAAQGYVAISISHRFAPTYIFPAQLEDAKCAVRWLRAHADELEIDPDRIGALGDSSGAHLAMMLGTTDASDGFEGAGGWADYSSEVQAVVSFHGPTNLLARFSVLARAPLIDFVGVAPEQNSDAWRRASPIHYVSAGDAPMLLFQGTKDPVVNYEQTFEMIEALTQAGVKGRVEILLGASHGWRGMDQSRTLEASLQFFDQQLRRANAVNLQSSSAR